MKLKFILLFLFQFYVLSTYSQEQWQWLNPKPSGFHNKDVCFISTEVGFIVNSSEILITSDAGNTWSKHREISYGLDIEFSGSTGYIMGQFNIYKSSDGGMTWNILSGIVANNFKSIEVVSPDTIILSNQNSLFKTFDGGQNWQSIVINVQGHGLKDISFVNSRLGFGTGDGASVHKTIDGGLTWTAVYPATPTSWSLDKIYFVNKDVGFAFCDSWITNLRTNDGGATWTSFENMQTIKSIQFLDDLNGFIGGEHGVFYTTTDAGATWSPYNGAYIGGEDIYGLFFTNIDTGYAVGSSGRIKKTSNGGLTWQIYSPTYRDLRGLAFTSNETGYCMMGGNLLKTTDGGITWNLVPSMIDGWFISIDFVNDTIGYALFDVYQEQLYKTTNGGTSWVYVPLDYPLSSHDMMAIDFINADTGFLTGGYSSSYLQKTMDGGQTWVKIAAESFTNIKFVNDSIGYGLKGGLSFFRTNDGGSTWTSVFESYYHDLNSFTFWDENTVYLIGDERKCYKSNDRGTTWEIMELEYDDYEYIKFRDKNIGYIIGDNLYKTTNAGYSWQKVTVPLSNITSSQIVITPNDNVYLAGTNGMMLGSHVTFDSISLASLPAVNITHDSAVLMGAAASNCMYSIENLKFRFSPWVNNIFEIDATPHNTSPGSVTRLSALLTGLKPLTQYNFWITGTSNGIEYFSESKSFYTLEQPQGISENKFSTIDLYPNPTSGIVSINSSEPVTSVELMDNTCRILNYYGTVNSIDLSALSSGVYFLRIHLKDNIAVLKVIRK